MVLCSGAFLVLPLGAKFASDAGIVSVNWLILSYALQSIGELMISGSAWRWSLSWFLSV
ncbi:tripeptide transporter permease [Klebsiella pneumoniae]|uniref:Tripeptide transporter permease n=1 Tax=Klebsiella pneumoniae TaxID=573 RepID=A0A377X8S0_KLEPN|nr:tripeptide transporter permease [Klebsiella pneumoniae]STW88560.1 tripeptide transporter permease [Klebsiella pneumoniae]